jgi:hypothetical protein
MSLLLRRVARGLIKREAATEPGARDPRLRGRTYAVPFETVWQAALKLAGGGLRRWKVTSADDQDGVIRATAKTFVLRYTDDVTIHIALDEDAQTRVDMTSASRKGVGDFGLNARRIARFFRALDRALAARRQGALEVPAKGTRDSAAAD